MKFNCPTCSRTISCPDAYAGKKAGCPKCMGMLVVPSPAPASTASPFDFSSPPMAEPEQEIEITVDSSDGQKDSPSPRPSGHPARYLPPWPPGGSARRFFATIRGVIWLLVTLWCFAPILWFVFTLIAGAAMSIRDTAMAGNHFAPPREPGLNAGEVFGMSLFAGGTLFVAFGYGLWCSVGIIMGAGLDRAVSVAEAWLCSWRLFTRAIGTGQRSRAPTFNNSNNIRPGGGCQMSSNPQRETTSGG